MVTLDSHGWLLVSYDGGDSWFYSDPKYWGDINFSSYKPGEPPGPHVPPSANYVPANYTPLIYSGGGSGGNGGGVSYPGYPTKYFEIHNDLNASLVTFTENIESYIQESVDALSQLYNKLKEDVSDPAYRARVEIAYVLFTDFASGVQGLDGITFNNDFVAEALRNSYGLEFIRNDFYTKANTLVERNFYTEPYRDAAASFGLQRFLGAGLDPIEQFVGSFDVKEITIENGFLKYTIWNKTSFESFFYHLTEKEWDLPGVPMSSVEQTFILYEPIDYSRLNNPDRFKPGNLPN